MTELRFEQLSRSRWQFTIVPAPRGAEQTNLDGQAAIIIARERVSKLCADGAHPPGGSEPVPVDEREVEIVLSSLRDIRKTPAEFFRQRHRARSRGGRASSVARCRDRDGCRSRLRCSVLAPSAELLA